MSAKSSPQLVVPPILKCKRHERPSVFTPDSMLRETRRQKDLEMLPIPEICILDPDGDIVRHLRVTGRATLHTGWACYHSKLYVVRHEDMEFGIVPCVVGAPYAVLVAEELFASGCRFLISVTSSGQIRPIKPPPYFMIIDRALRDEGTSYHYLPASDYSYADESLLRQASTALAAARVSIEIGPTWTTDAPFRETQEAIDVATQEGVLAVEMEAAALYAFARARKRAVVCLAHVTNRMGRIEGDFDKGAASGVKESLRVIETIAAAWLEQAGT